MKQRGLALLALLVALTAAVAQPVEALRVESIAVHVYQDGSVQASLRYSGLPSYGGYVVVTPCRLYASLEVRGLPGLRPGVSLSVRGHEFNYTLVNASAGYSVRLTGGFTLEPTGILVEASGNVSALRPNATLPRPPEAIHAAMGGLNYTLEDYHAQEAGSGYSVSFTALLHVGSEALEALRSIDIKLFEYDTQRIGATVSAATTADIRYNTSPNRILPGLASLVLPRGGSLGLRILPPTGLQALPGSRGEGLLKLPRVAGANATETLKLLYEALTRYLGAAKSTPVKVVADKPIKLTGNPRSLADLASTLILNPDEARLAREASATCNATKTAATTRTAPAASQSPPPATTATHAGTPRLQRGRGRILLAAGAAAGVVAVLAGFYLALRGSR
ncbi:MAG: hypothetical protein GSR80_001324 [Desulfurococcales archaeon]|nr:hypothetical protein [Desulfurococcales archaeon]